MTDNPTPNDIALLREALKPFANADIDISGTAAVGVTRADILRAYEVYHVLTGQHDGAAGDTGDLLGRLADDAALSRERSIACRKIGDQRGALVASQICDDIDEAVNVIRRLSAHDGAAGEGAAIPAGMKPWAGGDSAPADWDGGDVLRRNGEVTTVMGPSGWCRPAPTGLEQWDIIAYTPKPSTEQARAEGYVLVPQVPTREMLEASAIEWTALCCGYPPEAGHYKFMRALWAAMLAATPSGADALGDGL